MQKDNAVRNTRSAVSQNNIIPERSRLDLRQNFFTVRAAKSWNSLPDILKSVPTLNMFKSKVKRFLLESGLPQQPGIDAHGW